MRVQVRIFVGLRCWLAGKYFCVVKSGNSALWARL
jgi:hypothetical protein